MTSNQVSRVKHKIVLALSSFALVVFLSSCCRPEIIGSVPNTLRPQETDNWCWAATTQMLAEYLGLSITQCALANHRFNKTNCCTEQTSGTPCPRTDDCNTPGWVDLDLAPAKSRSTQPGVLQSSVLGHGVPEVCSVQQFVLLNRWLASAHCVIDKPRYSARICVVAAQHQLSVSCGRKVFGTLPIISGRQQLDRNTTSAKLESARTILCFTRDT